MKLTWIGQGGFVVKSKHTEIIVDPYLSDIVEKLQGFKRMVEAPFAPEAIKADAVVCTHDHLDHVDPDAVVKMRDEQYFVTTVGGAAHIRDLGKKHVDAITQGESVVIGEIEVTAVFAKHSTEAFGVILRAEGKTLYISGDTLFDEALFEIAKYRPDVSIVCINGKLGNMNVEEALLVAEKIGAKVNIPTHYGMFESNTEDPAKFTDRVQGGFTMEHAVEYDMDEVLCGRR